MQVTFDPRIGRLDVVDLPELVGSPKQIAWADDIRARKLNIDVGDYFRSQVAKLPREIAQQEIAKALANMTAAFAAIYANTSAKFWIECRGDIRILAKEAAAKISG